MAPRPAPRSASPRLTSVCLGPVALMLGNEGQGLSARQMALCDKFVYIAQVLVAAAVLGAVPACIAWASARRCGQADLGPT